ncbi:MAG: thiamine-phosphate kinase [Gemmatimonadota bacterium]|nr:MAG: thiamine-phosphate kinase [Gemmatimonadota bacterium]
MSSIPLGPGAEFDIIRRILEGAEPPGPEIAVASGDDCALLRAEDFRYLAVTVDLTVEGAHFLPDWGTPELVGGRAVRASVSDLAAMAAVPLGVLVALNVPGDSEARLAEQVGAGCLNAAAALGAPLIGGDLSRGGGALALDVTALGLVERPLLRSGARPDDELWVTGQLGAAAAAVGAWKAGEPVPEEWSERFWCPQPRLVEARWLSDHGATAGIDLSDGLVADAGHIAAASDLRIEIDWEEVPAATGVDPELALTGGEDYELLVAAPDGIFGAEQVSEFERTFGIPLTRVGRAVKGVGVRVFRDGKKVKLDSSGHDHFQAG